MTDKEKIRQELERIEQILDDFNKTHNNTIDNGIVSAMKNICKHIKSFIDSLPEENHFEDKSEMVSEDLEEVADKYAENHGFRVPYDGSNKFYDDVDVKASKEGFIAGAEWQRKKDQETIELAEDHAMLAGMNKMKEKMMKDAIESIVEDWCGDSPEVTIPLNPQDFKTGDKLKILILKTE